MLQISLFITSSASPGLIIKSTIYFNVFSNTFKSENPTGYCVVLLIVNPLKTPPFNVIS